MFFHFKPFNADVLHAFHAHCDTFKMLNTYCNINNCRYLVLLFERRFLVAFLCYAIPSPRAVVWGGSVAFVYFVCSYVVNHCLKGKGVRIFCACQRSFAKITLFICIIIRKPLFNHLSVL